MTPADRLALAVCRVDFPGQDRRPMCSGAPCSSCRLYSQAVAHELAALLRERHGHSATADWLEAVGSHTPETSDHD